MYKFHSPHCCSGFLSILHLSKSDPLIYQTFQVNNLNIKHLKICCVTYLGISSDCGINTKLPFNLIKDVFGKHATAELIDDDARLVVPMQFTVMEDR